MTDAERDRIQLIGLDDQLFATLRQHTVVIKRIAENGPQSGDDRITQMVCCYVVARLLRPD